MCSADFVVATCTSIARGSFGGHEKRGDGTFQYSTELGACSDDTPGFIQTIPGPGFVGDGSRRIQQSGSLQRSNKRLVEPKRSIDPMKFFEDLPVRRGRAGLGYQAPVLQGRHLHNKETWGHIAKPAKYIQVFSWNAGNLQRTSKCDTLNDLLASQFHIACLQEAAALSTQHVLFESRGIRSVVSRDRQTMINAGGTGVKIIRKGHKDSAAHCDMVHRPYSYNDPETDRRKQCLWYLCAGIVSLDGDLNDLDPMERGGQYVWRVRSIRLDNVHAKKQKEGASSSNRFLYPDVAWQGWSYNRRLQPGCKHLGGRS